MMLKILMLKNDVILCDSEALIINPALKEWKCMIPDTRKLNNILLWVTQPWWCNIQVFVIKCH